MPYILQQSKISLNNFTILTIYIQNLESLFIRLWYSFYSERRAEGQEPVDPATFTVTILSDFRYFHIATRVHINWGSDQLRSVMS